MYFIGIYYFAFIGKNIENISSKLLFFADNGKKLFCLSQRREGAYQSDGFQPSDFIVFYTTRRREVPNQVFSLK
jgi:hypothetical protein